MTESFNPYEVTFDDTAPTPEQLDYVRNIRAICWLYLFMGLIGLLFGTLAFSGGDRTIGVVLFLTGAVASPSAIGLLSRRHWGVPGCKFASVIYLAYIPFGTILGIYFLRNVHKVRHLLS